MSQNLQKTPDPVIQAPATGEAAAAMLRTASERRQSVVIRGAGTKFDWGRPPTAIDLILETRGLNRILAHAHGDLTATIEAGASLADVNRALASHGQWLPLDPPFADRATIGGLLATNDSGPLRHRHGTPRDLVIGVHLATTDGVIAKAGGQVVKNVAGYDLSKLVTGSFGSLAAIVSATFKLAPVPASSKTLRVTVRDFDALAAHVRTIMASQVEPVAFDVAHASSNRRRSLCLLIRFASLPQVVDAQIEAARRLLGHAASYDVLDDDAERACWHEHDAAIWNAPGMIVRASWMPATIAHALAELERTGGADVELIGRAAVGAGLIRFDADVSAQARLVNELRRSRSFANIVVRRGSRALAALVDVWGPLGDRGPLLATLKQTLDPHGTLNAGRGPL